MKTFCRSTLDSLTWIMMALFIHGRLSKVFYAFPFPLIMSSCIVPSYKYTKKFKKLNQFYTVLSIFEFIFISMGGSWLTAGLREIGTGIFLSTGLAVFINLGLSQSTRPVRLCPIKTLVFLHFNVFFFFLFSFFTWFLCLFEHRILKETSTHNFTRIKDRIIFIYYNIK